MSLMEPISSAAMFPTRSHPARSPVRCAPPVAADPNPVPAAQIIVPVHPDKTRSRRITHRPVNRRRRRWAHGDGVVGSSASQEACGTQQNRGNNCFSNVRHFISPLHRTLGGHAPVYVSSTLAAGGADPLVRAGSPRPASTCLFSIGFERMELAAYRILTRIRSSSAHI